MAGDSSRCIEGRILPLDGAHVSVERLSFRWPLPPVAGSPDRRVLSASLTAVRSSSLPRVQLVGPYKSCLNLTALPCSHDILQLHASGTNPGSIPGHLPYRIPGFCLPHREIRSATSIRIDFGAMFPFTGVPAYNLPVYASQCPLPDTTQDLVRGRLLGFAAAAISGD